MVETYLACKEVEHECGYFKKRRTEGSKLIFTEVST